MVTLTPKIRQNATFSSHPTSWKELDHSSTRKQKAGARLLLIILAACYALYRMLPSSSHDAFKPARHHRSGFITGQRSTAETVPIWTTPLGASSDVIRLTPFWELVILVASVQEQMTTWQDGSRTDRFLQMVTYLRPEDHDHAQSNELLLRVNVTFPDFPHVPATRCRPFSEVSNKLHLAETIHYDELIWIECDIPDRLHRRSQLPRQLPFTLEYDPYPLTESVRMDMIDETKADNLWDSQEQRQRRTQHTLALHRRDEPMSNITVCLTPFFGWLPRHRQEQPIPLVQPLRLIEWRLTLLKLGVDRVVWYSRRDEDEFIRLITELMENIDSQDVLILSDDPDIFARKYHDQYMWYNHCASVFRSSSVNYLILDLDEIPAVHPDDYDEPAAAFRRWIDSWDDDVGAMRMMRMNVKMSQAGFDKHWLNRGADYDTLMQDVWTHQGGPLGQALTKAVYRAESVNSMWVHNPRIMYPIPSQLSFLEPQPYSWPKPYMDEEKSWRVEMWQDQPGVAIYTEKWPRMYHYRWWGSNPSETFNMTIGDVPLPTSPIREAFMDQLRDECLVLTGKIARENFWEDTR